MTHFEALEFGLSGTKEISECWGQVCVQQFPGTHLGVEQPIPRVGPANLTPNTSGGTCNHPNVPKPSWAQH